MQRKLKWTDFDSFSGFQYPAALMNLGAILHLNGKLQEAEANYLRALDLKPDDTITQSNLRKLWNIMEKQGLRTMSPWPPSTYHHPATGPPARLEQGGRTGPSARLAGKRREGLREVVASKRPAGVQRSASTTGQSASLRSFAALGEALGGKVSGLWRTVVKVKAPHRNHTLISPCVFFFFPLDLQHLSLKPDRYTVPHCDELGVFSKKKKTKGN